MKSFIGGFCLVVAASSLVSFGCGAAVSDEEPVSQLREAINISNWGELVAIGETGSYTLTANINAAGRTWTPKTFSGTFDGGNRTISKLTINSGSYFAGLANATIRQVRFANLTLTF